MCFFCCVTLRGATYFMVTVHMVGTFSLSLIAIEVFLNPPNYSGTNVSPLIMSQLPLIVASYSMLASIFACFIFRAIDMDSISQLKLSATSFGVYQSLVLCVQLIFSVMFGDIVSKSGQGVIAGVLIINFFLTLIYLTVLFLYGKQLHELKYGSPKLCRNSLNPLETNNWGLLPSLYSKEFKEPGLNLLENHPPITRSNSEANSVTVSVTVSTGTNTENEEEGPTSQGQVQQDVQNIPTAATAIQIQEDTLRETVPIAINAEMVV